MRHVIVSSLLAGIALFASSPAGAVPMQDVQCRAGGAPLKNTANGMGLLFDAGCTTAYVLPPKEGNVSVTSLTANPNVQYCPAVLNLHTSLDAALAQMMQLDAKIDAYLADFDRLRADLDALQLQLDVATNARTQADADWGNAVNTKISFQADVTDAQSAYDDCVLINSEAECVNESQALASANATLASFITGTYNPAQAAADAAEAQYTTVFNAFSAKLDDLNSALDPILQLEAQLDAVNTTIQNAYSNYASLEGARGTLGYSVPWDAVSVGYHKANPLAPWTYVPMPMTSASFAATAVVGGAPTSIPAVLWATWPGDGGDGGTPQDAGMTVMGHGGLVTATLGLGLTGACPFFPDGKLKTAPVTIDPKGLAAYVTANVTYHYSVYVRRSFVQLLSSSTLIAKLKKILPTFDPLGPTQLAVVVRQNVEGEALRVDLNDINAQHVALDSQINGLNKVNAGGLTLTKDVVATPPVNTLAKTALTKPVLVGGTKPPIKIDPVPPRPIDPDPLPPHPIDPDPFPPIKKPPIILPPIVKPVYQAIDVVGTLTFVP